ncbi:uncharacterized protein LOC122064517 [Macadamia integrifolia]|uniref:uncharacterized protein LOC122064517 n=1 Tax=Macadamia integrifolia TaxID=60698 RepID=UPI001C4EB761|nr:uncharacterized protein LOC122064517 [Macadamia integrifolia]
MATSVLRSQDCLRDRFSTETLSSPSFKPCRNPNPNLHPKPKPKPKPNPNPNPSSTRSAQKKRTSVGSKGKESRRSRCETSVARLPAKNLIMGQVTILKRGEVLKLSEVDRVPDVVAEEAKIDEVYDLCSIDRLGPEPDTVPNQIGLADVKSVDCVFAGSAFFTSPPPSSLPLPRFFTKKDLRSKNDDAATDLQRILPLDLL